MPKTSRFTLPQFGAGDVAAAEQGMDAGEVLGGEARVLGMIGVDDVAVHRIAGQATRCL